MKTKRNIKEVVQSLLKDGEILSEHWRGNNSYVIVKAYGHTYWIDNPYGAKPRIKQLDAQNVSKN